MRTEYLNRVGICLAILWLAHGNSGIANQPTPWRVLDSQNDSLVQLQVLGDVPEPSTKLWLVLTHGMNGTEQCDQLHLLGRSIQHSLPDTAVLLVDWSDASRATLPFTSLPNPLRVSKRIDPVAAELADNLEMLGVVPGATTMIGESFGCYVNARTARIMGGVDRMLAMNPASELAGYQPPDLSQCAQQSWAFHSYSLFDTLDRIAHYSVILEPLPKESDRQRHASGVLKLIQILSENQSSFLNALPRISSERADTFDAMWTREGGFESTRLIRCMPKSIDVGNSVAHEQPPSDESPLIGH